MLTTRMICKGFFLHRINLKCFVQNPVRYREFTHFTHIFYFFRRKTWLNILGLQHLEWRKDIRICEKHFRKEMFSASGKHLFPWALPHREVFGFKNEQFKLFNFFFSFFNLIFIFSPTYYIIFTFFCCPILHFYFDLFYNL